MIDITIPNNVKKLVEYLNADEDFSYIINYYYEYLQIMNTIDTKTYTKNELTDEYKRDPERLIFILITTGLFAHSGVYKVIVSLDREAEPNTIIQAANALKNDLFVCICADKFISLYHDKTIAGYHMCNLDTTKVLPSDARFSLEREADSKRVIVTLMFRDDEESERVPVKGAMQREIYLAGCSADNSHLLAHVFGKFKDFKKLLEQLLTEHVDSALDGE